MDDLEVRVKERNNEISYDDHFFKCLGFNGKNYYFYHKPTGQVWSFTAREMNKSQLMMLAPLWWWEQTYAMKTRQDKTDWELALDALLRVQEKVGIFDIECVRGRGAWIDEGRPVLHLGNKIIVNGSEENPDTLETEYIYRKGSALSLDYGAYLPVEESRKLVQACKLARWEKESYGDLLAGWLFASLVCGVMPFRSHVYLTGESGSGKSWVMDNIVSTVMGRMPLMCSSKTTEAGIRKMLKNDVRPVIFNETEAESQSDQKRLQGVFDLARAASDEHAAPILKGSGDGESFICRSSFLFAAINKAISQHADENRTIFLELAGSPKNVSQEEKDQDNANFKELERVCTELLSKEFVGSLLTRAVELIPVMRANHEIFSDVGAKVTGSRRVGASMAMPLCGLYGLMSDEVITEAKAIAFIKKYTKETEKDEVSDTQEQQCLDKLMFTEIMCEDKGDMRHTIQVAEVIHILNSPHNVDDWNKEKLKKAMSARGLLVKEGYLWLASKKDAMPAKCYEQTQFSSSWKEAIKRLDGVKAFRVTHFCKTLKTTGIKIPLGLIFDADE